MNKVLPLLIIFFISSTSFSQVKKKESHARITSTAYLENLLKSDSSDQYVITSEFTDSKSGIKHTYIRQAIDGVEVYGTESSIHKNANGKTLVAHVNFVDGINNSARNISRSMSAEQVIASVSQQMGYELNGLRQIENLSGPNQKGVFNKAGISRRDIPVKLMYFYREDIGLKMVWELSIRELDSPDWWNFWADATTGNIIDKNNWTVSCKASGDHSDHGHEMKTRNKLMSGSKEKKALPLNKPLKNVVRAPGAYTVFGLPMESPYSGPRIVEIDPDNATASPLGWHDDGVSAYTYTRGNNVSAYYDGDDDDDGSLADHTPESATGSVYDYAFDATDAGSGDPIYTAADPSIDAAITNLFYWNNIVHDIVYQYGFDEVSGNFQEDNFANGGAGGDSVDAQAQDSADLAPTAFNRCNANFGTPPDGGFPVMQMYVCDGDGDDISNDGDYDNVVVVHEYAHGISNRLIGGPAEAGALQNAEQMGEGWSDYYSYMLTMDVANATSDRAVGNFLIEAGPAGSGIRPAPYSTSLTTNPYTYEDVAASGTISSPHGIGFIWATMLYEMTQALITTYGFDPDLYNGTGGNNISLELVTLGLKLTPVSPGFVDGRDAILAADEALNGGVNQCLIWEAFAKRGLGFSASQGSSFDRFDGVEAMDMPGAFLDLNRPEICVSEGVVAGLGGGEVIGGTYSDVGGFVTDGGDGLTFSFDAASAGVGDHLVSYIEPCNGLDTMATLTVTDGIPELICKDVAIALDAAGNATLVQADVIANLIASGENGYTVDQTGTFAVETITGTAVALGDDSGTAALPLGFVFNYFGTEYSDIHIASNGYVSFTGAGLGEWIPASLPSGTEPNGMIAVVWDDWSPNIGGTISYEVIGVAPNRKMVVNYDNVPHYSDATTTLTAQLQLHEGTNRIEIHTTNATDNAGVRTQGVENEAGDMAIPVPGRNLVSWGLTNDYVAFVPVPGGLADNCGNPVVASLSQSIFSCADIGDNIITITADDGNGGITTCQTTVTVTNSINPCIVVISPIALLQGPILNPTSPGLMNDMLREDGFLPTTSPYADALPVDPNVFNTGGLSGTGLAEDDIVDWVWVELRDAGDNTNIIVGQSALLQRDGDVVALDGTIGTYP